MSLNSTYSRGHLDAADVMTHTRLLWQGLHGKDLTVLKRGAARSSTGARVSDAGGKVALHSGGTCFDFAPDGNTYLVATDDGVVHQVCPCCPIRCCLMHGRVVMQNKADNPRECTCPQGQSTPTSTKNQEDTVSSVLWSLPAAGRPHLAVNLHPSAVRITRPHLHGMPQMQHITGAEDVIGMQSNTSYADQTMRKFSGHIGPVYTVTWSPFASDFFLTASADWTVKLWRDKKACPPAPAATSAQCLQCVLLSWHSLPAWPSKRHHAHLGSFQALLHAWLPSWLLPSTLCGLCRWTVMAHAIQAPAAMLWSRCKGAARLLSAAQHQTGLTRCRGPVLCMQEAAVLTFQTPTEDVMDVAWSPHSATIFACLTCAGALEIWDLEVSSLQPVAKHSPAEPAAAGDPYSCLAFSSVSPHSWPATGQPSWLPGQHQGPVLQHRLHGTPQRTRLSLSWHDQQASAG